MLKTIILASVLLALPGPAQAGARNVQTQVPPEVYTDQGGHHNGGVRVEGREDRATWEADRRAAMEYCHRHHGNWRHNHCTFRWMRGEPRDY